MKRIHKTILTAIAFCLPLFAGQAKERPRMNISESFPREYGQWQDALLAGNGKTGIMVFGNPRHETVVFNDRRFNFPAAHPRTFNTIPKDSLTRIRELCALGQFEEANRMAATLPDWKAGGEGGRHPGYQLRIDLPENGTVSDYRRSCDFSTGVIRVEWSDSNGKWVREAFVSRPENVTVLRLKAPSKGKLDCAVSLSLDKAMGFPEGTSSRPVHDGDYLGIEVNYPDMPLSYGGGIRVKVKGGSRAVRHDTLFISGADEAVIIGCNYHHKGGIQTAQACREAIDRIPSDFDRLLKRHVRTHRPIYNRMEASFAASPEERALSNEKLLQRQKGQEEPLPALWERIFDAGRYHFLSSSSEETPPDLLGIWTGDCNAGWGGYYHLDANLNLQVSGGNTGAMPEAMEGYFNLIETWRTDFETNARKLLGCRGMLAGGNSPGLSSGLMAAINNDYPYQYATGEMAWLLYPFWEHYLITRDETFLRGRLFPLLCIMGEFYEDFLQATDDQGDYILAGSVSPENRPENRNVPLMNNSVFDISGARFLLSTLVKACDLLGEEQGATGRKARWQAMLDKLPPYLVNPDGALQEWAWPGLKDHYGHRHSSHLLTVWPYREISPSSSAGLYRAACKALELRTHHRYDDSGHGFLVTALAAAGLHKDDIVEHNVNYLLKNDFYYTGLCTSHNGNHQVFCTDVAHGTAGILIEMLVGSDEEGIDLLPALPALFEKGSATGIETRCGATIEHLSWDYTAEEAVVTLKSRGNRTIRLRSSGESREIQLKSGKPVTVSMGIRR